jgi:hypothetical protein
MKCGLLYIPDYYPERYPSASHYYGIGQQQVPDFIGIRERRGSSTWAGNRQRQFSYFV